MKKITLKLAVAGFFLTLSQVQASTCPDPMGDPLQRGEVPAPWIVSPFSDWPQGGVTTRFVMATILVAGRGRGVVCRYHNSAGDFSIWWEVSVKIPARVESNWRDSLAGFDCTDSFESCVFYTAT